MRWERQKINCQGDQGVGAVPETTRVSKGQSLQVSESLLHFSLPAKPWPPLVGEGHIQLSPEPCCRLVGSCALTCMSEVLHQLSCDQKALPFVVHELTPSLPLTSQQKGQGSPRHAHWGMASEHCHSWLSAGWTEATGRAGRHDTKRCPGDKPRQGPESCTLSQDIRGNSQAAPPPPPRGEDALRDSGVSTREGCASSSSKKRTLFPLSIFFFPSGLNPLLERDKSISRETGSLRSQGLSQLPLSFCHGVTQQRGWGTQAPWGIGLMGPPQARSTASTRCSEATRAVLPAGARATIGPSWGCPALDCSHKSDYGDWPCSQVSHYWDWLV